MKTLLKVIAGVFAAVFIIVAAMFAWVAFVFDPNDHKDRISAAVLDATGRKLSIDGDLSLSLFPRLGVELPALALENAPGFNKAPMFAIESASAKIELLPLLKKQIRVGKVSLNGLEANLAVNEQGQNNWQDIADRLASEQKPSARPEPAEEGDGFEMQDFSLEGIEVTEGRLFYNDAKAGAEYEVRGLSLSTGAIEQNKDVSFSAGLTLVASEPEVTLAISAKGLLAFDSKAQTLALKPLEASFDASGSAVPGQRQEGQLLVRAVLDNKAGTLNISELLANAAGAKIKASAVVKGLDSDIAYTGNLSLEKTNLKNLLAKLGITLETSDSKALSSLEAKAAFSGGRDSISLADINTKLDDTTLLGRASITNFSNPAISFDVEADSLNADRYLPPSTDSQKQKDAGKKEPSTEQEIPIEALKKLNLVGSARLGELVVKKITTKNASVRITAKNGLIRLENLNADFYQGKIAATATVDARQSPLKINFAPKADAISFGPLLADFLGKETLTGLGRFSADISASGATTTQLLKSLGGNAAFLVENGTVKGINVAELVRGAWAMVKGESQATDGSRGQTDFVSLSANIGIEQGIAKNSNLALASPLFNISGQGQADLASKTVDYLIQANATQALQGLGSIGGINLSTLPVPIAIVGSFEKLSYRPDVKALAQSLVQSRTGEAQQRITEALPQEVRGLLPGIMPQQTRPPQEGGDAKAGEQASPQDPVDAIKRLFR
ncbi:MAG: AsmA family protein [Desulfatibacillaceae bacterium]|nr:AsmA family protein [Desulfatibacillaceae bacterium]